jgi:glycosyltransferase involved in cell wall biosynthesis
MGSWRVGLVCGHYDPTRDGVADYTRHLQHHLAGAGVEALVCTAYRYARSGEPHVVGVAASWNLRGILDVARHLRSLRLDILHVQFAPSAFGFSRSVGLLPALPMPSVVTLHEYGVWTAQGATATLRSAAWGMLERRGYVDRETLLLTPHADQVFVVADEHAGLIRERFAQRPVSIRVVPVGPNIAVVHTERERARRVIRERLGLTVDAPLAVFFGFLHPVKALDRLIEAVALVRSAVPGLHLVLAGGEESHSVMGTAAATLRHELERVAHQHHMEDDVTFTGYLPESEVSLLLQGADVAVFPFDAGVTSKSGSLLAARMHGVPVIATAPPGTLEAPTEMQGVLRVPPRDTDALAEALRLVLSDRGLRDRLATANRTSVTPSTWEAIAAVHVETYADVMRSRSRVLG